MKSSAESGRVTETCDAHSLSMTRWACLLAIPFAALAAGCDSQTQSDGAHVHGIASLTLAIDEPTAASIEFVSPAESIYGFEHEASTAVEIAARDEALTALESRFDEMLVLPDALGCWIEDSVVEVVLEDDHDDEGGESDHDDGDLDDDGEESADDDGGADADHDDDGDQDDDGVASVSGQHTEVRALYRLACAGQLDGAEARIAIGEVFAGVETLNVTVLSGSGQRSDVLEGGVGSIDL